MSLLSSEIDLHASAALEVLLQEKSAALRSNRIDPRFLYVTARQAELWREVSRRHAPVHRDPGFLRLYDEAFARMAGQLQPEIALIGLGCGTGQKEAQLHTHLQQEGRAIFFSAIDVSRELVLEAAVRLVASGAQHRRSLVCDLNRMDVWRDWLNEQAGPMPRVITFFGLAPNFPPSQLGDIWRAALRSGDTLLASVHLVPAGNESANEIATAMQIVLPQYDNPETLAWLQAGLEVLELDALVHPPTITIGEVEGIPAFIGSARWQDATRTEPLRLFASLRYTPAMFEALAQREGFLGERLAITPCRQEAVWCIRRG